MEGESETFTYVMNDNKDKAFKLVRKTAEHFWLK